MQVSNKMPIEDFLVGKVIQRHNKRFEVLSYDEDFELFNLEQADNPSRAMHTYLIDIHRILYNPNETLMLDRDYNRQLVEDLSKELPKFRMSYPENLIGN